MDPSTTAPAAEAGSGSFPVVVALDALDAWLRDPTLEHRAGVEHALGAIVRSAGARGARLEIHASPLPDLVIADGTLAGAGAGAGAGDEAASAGDEAAAAGDEAAGDAFAEAPGVVRHELVASEADIRLGTLWLDRPAAGSAASVRALELALAAGWSRAEVRQVVERLAALDDATRAIAGILNLDRVLQLIVDRVRDLAGARYAALGIFDERGIVERFLTSGISREERQRIGAPPRGRGLLGALLREGRSIRLADLADDPRSVGFPAEHPPMRSFLGVPIMVKGGSVGNLYLTDKQATAEFSIADQEIVELFAVHAGIAIENARLHEQVQRLVIIEERERIGRDLHDGIIQSLYAVGLSLEDLPDLMEESPGEASARVDRAIESLNLTIRDIRNFIFGLRPELLEEADAEAALGALADEFRMNTLIDIELVVGPDVPELPSEERTQILQIARECLSNIARHSRATRATVELSVDESGLRLEVLDNGRGFDPAAVRGPSHQGLANIRGRARAMGGDMSIESEPGAGTRIIVTLPPRDAAAVAGGTESS
jgi:signal transduction histidine kinase